MAYFNFIPIYNFIWSIIDILNSSLQLTLKVMNYINYDQITAVFAAHSIGSPLRLDFIWMTVKSLSCSSAKLI